MQSADSVCKEFWAQSHPPGRTPDREVATTETCQLPTEARCQERTCSSPRFIYCTHQGHSQCVCRLRAEQERHVAEGEIGQKMKCMCAVMGVLGGLSDMVNLHLGLKPTCQQYFLTTMPH